MGNGNSRQEMEQHKKVLDTFSALPGPAKLERLKQFGILDEEGNLSAIYRAADGRDRKPVPPASEQSSE